MGSQLDLDQGGTFRQRQRVYLGPSVGWIEVPYSVWLPVTVGGTTNVLRGNTLVTINFNGNVTLQLPSSLASAAGAQAIPGSFIDTPLTIVDIGGFAQANTYLILPFGSETIDNQASIQLVSAYGAFILKPQVLVGGWSLIQ